VAALGAALTVPLRGAVAHSFGGKVALQLVGAASLEHVALIDSTPGARFDHRGSEFTMHVLELLDTLEGRTWASRDEFVRTLMANGQARDIALWLAMNLISESGRVRFALELPRIHALLASYFSLDAWAVLEQNSGPQFHIVLGERSGVYDDQDKARLAALQATSKGRISVDTLPAGHWVHVDDFEGLLRVLVNRIAPQQP
jgi:pimeloyl-ACP methyl ester carboxylesterase